MLASITVTITALSVLKAALSVLKAVVVISLILTAYAVFTGALKEKNKSAKFTLFGTTLTQIVAIYLICSK